METDLTNYIDNKGFRLITVRTASMESEDDNITIEAVGVRVDFSEVFDSLFNNDEEKLDKIRRGSLMEIQMEFVTASSMFTEGISYILEKAGIKREKPSKDVEINYWLKDNDTVTVEINHDVFLETIKDINIEDEKVWEEISFMEGLAAYHLKGSCRSLLKHIKENMTI